MEKLNKLTLPATILIASIILGGFYYASQVNKQRSIEKQQQIDIQTKTAADQAKAEQDKAQQDAIKQGEAVKAEQAQTDQQMKQERLDRCMTQAHKNYVDERTAYCLQEGYTLENLDKCLLPAYKTKEFRDSQEHAQAICVELFK